MYLHIVTKQGKDPSTKRKGKRQRWHSGLKVDKVVSDTLLRQPSPREVVWFPNPLAFLKSDGDPV